MDDKEKIENESKEEIVNNENAANIEEDKAIPKKNHKKAIIIAAVVLLIIIVLAVFFLLFNGKEKNKEDKKDTPEETLKQLPLPEVTGGQRGELGIDKNINESTIDEYLNRPDSVYRDMRMLDDPATYENIGGDRFLSGYIKGFEVVPLPYLIPVDGLPQEVGKTYSGLTLFDIDEEGNYYPVYEESMSILESLFPKDKVIFLMCGGGGYAGMTKAFLVSLGWDETKIYNIGGFWYYDGNNKVEVTKTETGYDFSNVPYHEIKFENLTELEREAKLPIYVDDIYYNNREGKGIETYSLSKYDDPIRVYSDDHPEKIEALKNRNADAKKYADVINNLMKNRKSFIIAIFPDDTCYADTGDPSFLNNMRALAEENNLYYYYIGLLVYKQTDLYKQVKYAPTVIIVYKGKILAYLDAESDEHLKYAKDPNEFNKWFKSYVNVTK